MSALRATTFPFLDPLSVPRTPVPPTPSLASMPSDSSLSATIFAVSFSWYASSGFWCTTRRVLIISGSMAAASARKSILSAKGEGRIKALIPKVVAVSRDTMTVVGIDLAGSEKRNTGFCVMDAKMRCNATVLHTDGEILAHTLAARPKVVSIDAPLFLPKGRESLEKRGPPHFRECDKELLKMHIRFFPISLGPMRMLTARGMKLRADLERYGLEAIESFPGAIQDLLGMPRKQKGLPELAEALERYGIDLGSRRDNLNGDELDAVTSALVGLLYTKGEFRAIGDPSEGLMILPKGP